MSRPRSDDLTPFDPRLPQHPMNAPAQTIERRLQARKSVAGVLVQFQHNTAWLQGLRDHYRALMGRDLEPQIRAKLAQDDLAEALYLLNAPLPSTRNDQLAGLSSRGTTPAPHGTGSHYAFIEAEILHKTRGAVLSPGTATTPGEPFNRAFGFAYEGAQAADYRWLQLIWRERSLEIDGVVKPEKGNMITSGGQYPLTHDVSDKKYNVDVPPTCATPFYEDGGAAIRTPALAVIFDQPTAGDDLQSALYFLRKEPPGAILRSTAHFEVFLIHEYRAVYRYSISILDQWTQVGARELPAVNRDKSARIEAAEPVHTLPPAVRSVIRARFARFDYLLIV